MKIIQSLFVSCIYSECSGKRENSIFFWQNVKFFSSLFLVFFQSTQMQKHSFKYLFWIIFPFSKHDQHHHHHHHDSLCFNIVMHYFLRWLWSKGRKIVMKKKIFLIVCWFFFILLFTNVNLNGNEVRDEEKNTNKCENEREEKFTF